MPTYEYVCESCGYKFEKMQRMTEAKVKECPQCGQVVSRLVGTGQGGIMLKGKAERGLSYPSDSFPGQTCCGRDERCEIPPCSDDGLCQRS